jgi:hypothetical protein
VFHKTSFDINYWHNFCIITVPSAFPFGMTFRTFTQKNFFAKKCTLSLLDKILRIPFPALYYCILPFNEPMPITYSKGIKRPCHSSGTELLTFMREREMGVGFG